MVFKREVGFITPPPLETTMEDVLDVDIVYLSHIHQDHYDERYFVNFRKDIPIIVLDDNYNFLIKNLERNGFTNLILIKNNETKSVAEFKITLYAPFIKDNFSDAKVGNLIDSAMVVQNNNTVAINFNDNTPTVECCTMLREKFKKIDLAMINYNAAGPYPSCFNNLTKAEKLEEHDRILLRNYKHFDFKVVKINGEEVAIYSPPRSSQKLVSELDNKLLRRIFDRKANWNNAEGGCLVDFIRTPNIYEFDAHTALQFFHL